MSFHSFSLDPRTILGVGPAATAEEIHDAYRLKSKKHHPDMGGDDWAFRMVARAYEVLKTTSRSIEQAPWERDAVHVKSSTHAAEWSWLGNSASAGRQTNAENSTDSLGSRNKSEQASAKQQRDVKADEISEPVVSKVDLEKLKLVDIELIWTRFEKDGSSRWLPVSETDDSTLSVCLVMAWPPEDLVDHMSKFADAGETLKTLIELFEQLREQPTVVAARSRIEDGRLVGWLSYPDVLAAQDAYLKIRETFRDRGLNAKLHTRDERVPYDWQHTTLPTIMSRAS